MEPPDRVTPFAEIEIAGDNGFITLVVNFPTNNGQSVKQLVPVHS